MKEKERLFYHLKVMLEENPDRTPYFVGVMDEEKKPVCVNPETGRPYHVIATKAVLTPCPDPEASAKEQQLLHYVWNLQLFAEADGREPVVHAYRDSEGTLYIGNLEVGGEEK
ncbi:MAG: hypothetical protein Q4F28_04590 [Eubacteriales bacterium]|nr:hypothetical protein [Eubacteriales bacterium]